MTSIQELCTFFQQIQVVVPPAVHRLNLTYFDTAKDIIEITNSSIFLQHQQFLRQEIKFGNKFNVLSTLMQKSNTDVHDIAIILHRSNNFLTLDVLIYKVKV